MTIKEYKCTVDNFAVKETDNFYTAIPMYSYQLIPKNQNHHCLFKNHFHILFIDNKDKIEILNFKGIAHVDFFPDNLVPTISELEELEKFSIDITSEFLIQQLRDNNFLNKVSQLPYNPSSTTQDVLKLLLNSSYPLN